MLKNTCIQNMTKCMVKVLLSLYNVNYMAWTPLLINCMAWTLFPCKLYGLY